MKRSTTLSALALASGLALAGCGAGGQDTASETTAPATSDATATTPASPSEAASPTGSAEAVAAEHSDADVMFARMMIPHHQQAVEMSEILLAKEDVPAEVRGFAQQVIDAQGPEIQRMGTMLSTWGEEPAMSESGGMDHGGHGGMNGMMSEEDMAALEAAQGTEAARLYLEQMTAHHRGAIEMAQDEVDGGTNPQAVTLAQDVISAQEAEITLMQDLLQDLPGQS